MLKEELTGYLAYSKTVSYRLIPHRAVSTASTDLYQRSVLVSVNS